MAKTSETTSLHGIVPFPPMEAELVRELPEGDGWQYEPKSWLPHPTSCGFATANPLLLVQCALRWDGSLAALLRPPAKPHQSSDLASRVSQA
jgi:hypothetical protein